MSALTTTFTMPDSSATQQRVLVQALRSGDRVVQKRWVQSQQRPVFAVISRILRTQASAAEVEELAQEAFLRAFASLAGFDPDGTARLSTWLLRIASNLAIDRLRQIRRRPRGQGEVLAEGALVNATRDPEPCDRGVHGLHDLEAELRRRELARRLELAVAELEPAFRAAFVLRVHHHLDYAEIAEMLELDLGTVKSRISRARAKLRRALQECFDDQG